MVRQLLGAVTIVLLSVSASHALEIAQAVVTTAVEQRAPVDVVAVHPAIDTRLFCFTRVVGSEQPTTIEHVWFRGETEVARVSLPVNNSDWRTWSSKRIMPGWQGAWRIEVLDESGSLLRAVDFKLE